MTRTILPFAALLTGLFLSGCDDEAETPAQRGSAQFEETYLSLSENTGKTTITIAFNKNAVDDGEVQVKVVSSGIEKFQFAPAAADGVIKLLFFKGQSKISFDVTPVDNDLPDGDKTLDFTILSVPPGYDIGTTKTLSTVWVDDEAPAQANFELSGSQVRENNSSAYPVTISFSHATKTNGSVSISIQSTNAVYGTHFTTEPAASSGIITLPVEPGKDKVVFNVFPLDDGLYNEQRSISYTIVDAEGGLEPGGILEHKLTIKDDELEGLGKGYDVLAGNWRYKKRYEYNENGTISKVYWDRYTPGHSEGVYIYEYGGDGKVVKIIESAVREEIYIREGGRIVKSEEYTHNELTKYTLYGYDQAGNAAEASVHYRQPDGTLKLSSIFVYLYHMDHNVYKVLSYTVPEGSEEPVLNGTKTFDHYLDVENQFPMVEILPDQKAQNKLPASYRIEENGHDITYQFNYQYSAGGKPLSRTATSPGGSEIAYYEYY